MSDVLAADPQACLAALTDLVGLLNDNDIVPAAINVEWRHADRPHPYLNVWLRYRTDLEVMAAAAGLRVESGVRAIGQRHYWTKADGPGFLLQAVSYPHHDDWVGGDDE